MNAEIEMGRAIVKQAQQILDDLPNELVIDQIESKRSTYSKTKSMTLIIGKTRLLLMISEEVQP